MALGSRPFWVRRLLPGSHPEPALGSMAGVGRLLRGEGARGSMHGLPSLFLCGVPSSQSLARLSVLVLRPTRHLHSAHTHPTSAQTSSRTEKSWRPGGFAFTPAQITGTSGILFSPCQPCPRV